jgi:hypothetical protein
MTSAAEAGSIWSWHVLALTPPLAAGPLSTVAPLHAYLQAHTTPRTSPSPTPRSWA